MLGPHLQLLIEVLLDCLFILLDALRDVLLLLLPLHVFVLVHDHVAHPVYYPRHLIFTGCDLAQTLLLSRFHRLNFILDGLGFLAGWSVPPPPSSSPSKMSSCKSESHCPL